MLIWKIWHLNQPSLNLYLYVPHCTCREFDVRLDLKYLHYRLAEQCEWICLAYSQYFSSKTYNLTPTHSLTRDQYPTKPEFTFVNKGQEVYVPQNHVLVLTYNTTSEIVIVIYIRPQAKFPVLEI